MPGAAAPGTLGEPTSAHGLSRIPISVVIPTLDEGRNLRATLARLPWADEVIIADGGSTDDTVLVARMAGACVLEVPASTIGAQRNAAISIARNRWILALDADEQVSPELQGSLERLCRDESPAHAAFRVRSRNWHLGRELRYGPWGRDWKVRVFDNRQRFSDARVHESLVGLRDVGVLDGALLHHPYRDLSHHVVKVAKYASWAAEDLRARGRRATLVDLTVRPAWRFIRDYVVYSGWRDGRAGFVVAVVSAFSVFCKYVCLAIGPSGVTNG
jgi:glycosyltransferase involved in cell wall biosynthesis